MRGGVVRHTRADRVAGAAIDNEIVAQCDDPAVIGKADFDIVELIARMGRAHQVLLPILEPAHRPPEAAGEKRDQHILGIDMALEAEPAADIEGDAAHPRFRQTQDDGSFPPHPMHDLGRRPDRHRIGSRIMSGDNAAALHRHRGVAVVIKAALQPVRGAGKLGFDITLGDRERPEKVGLQSLVDNRRARPSAASALTMAGRWSSSAVTKAAASSAA